MEEEIEHDTREQSQVRADGEPPANASVLAKGPAAEQTSFSVEEDKLQQSIELLPYGETKDECVRRIRQALEQLMQELGK